MNDDIAIVRALRDDTGVDAGVLGPGRWDLMRHVHETGHRSGATQRVLDDIEERGYAIVEDVLSAEQVRAVRDALAPHFADGPHGRNDFEGFRTKRVYALPTKSRAFDGLIEDARVLEVADAMLGPGFLLTAALAIDIGPGETAQFLHYDEAFYGLPRPRSPLSLSTLWAIDEFTADNGGTLLVPGSHRWGDEQPDPSTPPVPLEMPAGAVALYPGTLWHAGGANVSEGSRLGISIQYVLSWGRQQESYLLEFPPERASALSPRMRELLGYSIGPAFMGHVDGRHPEKLVTRLR
jgi:ectoine hydroxylase-related dioxygenase (phytanoyl-CoA dioxygenase family)